MDTTGSTYNGSSGNDSLVGGLLDDSLYGFAGNDTLNGGAGKDLLEGGDGTDTYVFGIGSGHDTINAGDGWYDQPGLAPIDKVQLGVGIAPADFTLARVGSDLVLRLPGGNDSLTLQRYYDNGNYYGYSRVQLQFANGTLWGEAEIAAQLVHVDGSLGDDYLYGTLATDSMQGGQGNDQIWGSDNADTLLGGEGHDSLYGDLGNDLLDGGSGNDSLLGGDGSDTYVFGIDSGRDTINASDSWYDQVGVAPVDTIRLGAGIAPADLKLARVGDDLVLSLAGGSDSLTVQGYYYSYGDEYYYGYARVQLQFADGTLWGTTQIAAQLIHVDGTPGNDGLTGTIATDSIQGGQGNDWIYAGDNADTLLGGEGHDSLYGEQGDDLLDGGAGNDSLMGGDGSDSYVFGIGSGQDTIDASDGWSGQTPIAPVDTVRIGAGIAPADLKLACVGDDLVLSLAGGNDSLTVYRFFHYEYSNNYGRVQLQFADGTLWSAADIATKIIHVGGTPGNDGLNGTIATDSMQGGQGNDGISGGDNADTLLGGEGHDSLYGEQGNDLLDGGAGNDSLRGGDGADIYVFGIGSGRDTVDASDNWYWSGQVGVAPVDTVRLGAGIAPADLKLARVGDDLVLSLAGGSDSLTVQGYYYNYGNDNYGYTRVQFQFADGTLWSAADIETKIIHVEGTPGSDGLNGTIATDSMQGGQGNDWISAGDNADTLLGGDGHDDLYGEQGDDLLDGGSGNDGLWGGDGADTYVFGIGSGHDTVYAWDGWNGQTPIAPVDTVRLGAGIAPADLKLTRAGSDLVLSLA